MALATPGAVIALVFSLAFSTLPALAATTNISTDPFTQATCAASNTTYHHTEVEPDSFSNACAVKMEDPDGKSPKRILGTDEIASDAISFKAGAGAGE